MDLKQYSAVLRRHQRLVVAGVVLAVVLAFLSYVRVSPNGISYRNREVWQSQSTLLLSQAGFLAGRGTIPSSTAASAVDPGRLTDLYAQFANSDEVRRRMRRAGAPKTWKIVSTPVIPQLSGATLPVVALSGQAPSAGAAVKAAALGRKAFIAYVTELQKGAGIPSAQRIRIEVLSQSATPKPQLIRPRSKTLPIMVLLAVLSAAVGLAFVLENRSPRMRVVGSEAGDDGAGPALRDAAEPVTSALHDTADGDVASAPLRDVKRWG